MSVLIDKTATLSLQKSAPSIPEDYAPHPSSDTWTREAAERLFALPFMDLILCSSGCRP